MAAKILVTLICDDVRMENTNKLLLIGVYNYSITFVAPQVAMPQPADKFTLPKLCIVRRWLVESEGHKAKIEVRDPAGQPLLVFERPLEVPKDGSHYQEIYQIFGPILIPGQYKITTTYEDRGVQTDEQYFEVRVVDPASLGSGQVVAQPIHSARG